MKKIILVIHFFMVFVLVGCQNKPQSEIDLNDFYNEQSIVLNNKYPDYAVMLVKKNEKPVILALKSHENQMVVYRIIQVPIQNEAITITHFSIDEDESPQVILSYDGTQHDYTTVKRIGFSGHYYALEADTRPNGFEAFITDPCFGKDIVCPFTPHRDAFITGPHVDYIIHSISIHDDDSLGLPLFVDQWFIIDVTKRVYHVLAEYQNNLYYITVRLVDDELVYQSTLIETDFIYASYIGIHQTSLVITKDNVASIYNGAWEIENSFSLDGEYIRVIKTVYDGAYAIETSSNYYVLNGHSILHTIQKLEDMTYLGAQIIYGNEAIFKYYYLEDQTIKIINVLL